MRFGVKLLPLLGLILLLAGCKTTLYSGLPQREAAEMMAILEQHGIGVSRLTGKDDVESLLVDQADFAAAVTLLRQQGYPHRQFETVEQVFKPSGLVASPLEERARLDWAIGQELSQTISDIDGVLTARVQVVWPNNDLLRGDVTPSAASVFIRYAPHSNVRRLVPQIKMLVSSSVAGLDYDKVAVVMVRAAALPNTVAVARDNASSAPAWELPAAAAAAGLAASLAILGGGLRRRIIDYAGRWTRRREPAG